MEPVDPEALGIPDYFDVIKHPMDFSTIQHKLQSGELQTREEFLRLVRLVFDNALLYNQPGDPVYRFLRACVSRSLQAERLRQYFEQEVEQLSQPAAAKHHAARHRAVAMRCDAFSAMQTAFSDRAAEDPVVQRFLEARKARMLETMRVQTSFPRALEGAPRVRPRELSDEEIGRLKSQLEALRGAELRRILQILAQSGVGKAEAELPVRVQLLELPVETLRRLMFEIQKMQEEDYVACWNDGRD